VLGESDYRTPQDSGGEQLFRALKYMKRPTAMVVFPRETHELSRSGEPWHRIERLDHIVGWFDKWIMGVPHPLALERVRNRDWGWIASPPWYPSCTRLPWH
jgi:hypothetical protein